MVRFICLEILTTGVLAFEWAGSAAIGQRSLKRGVAYDDCPHGFGANDG